MLLTTVVSPPTPQAPSASRVNATAMLEHLDIASTGDCVTNIILRQPTTLSGWTDLHNLAVRSAASLTQPTFCGMGGVIASVVLNRAPMVAACQRNTKCRIVAYHPISFILMSDIH